MSLTRNLPFYLCVLLPLTGWSQSEATTTAPVPTLSVQEISSRYIAADWMPEQWDTLAGAILELNYFIDAIGEPFLFSVRGSESPAIFSKLGEVTATLPYFQAATRAGSRVDSSYTVWLQFPRFGVGPVDQQVLYPGMPRLVSPDTLRERFEPTLNAGFLDANVFYNRPLGEPGSYLKDGGGFDFSLGGRRTPRLGAGGIFGVEFNGRHRPFPEDPLPERDESGTGIFVGGFLDYNVYKQSRRQLSLRAELAYGLLNAANRLEPDDRAGSVVYRGLHSGLVLQFSLPLTDYKPGYYITEDQTSASYSALNLMAGIRYRYYGDRVGTGSYLFLGVGYRFARDDFRRK